MDTTGAPGSITGITKKSVIKRNLHNFPYTHKRPFLTGKLAHTVKSDAAGTTLTFARPHAAVSGEQVSSK